MGGVITSDSWLALEAAGTGHGLVRTRVHPKAPVDMFIALEKPSGARLVLIGLATEDVAQAVDIPKARGIEVTTQPLADGSAWGFAEVRLTDPRFSEVFTALADDLVDYVAVAPSP